MFYYSTCSVVGCGPFQHYYLSLHVFLHVCSPGCVQQAVRGERTGRVCWVVDPGHRVCVCVCVCPPLSSAAESTEEPPPEGVAAPPQAAVIPSATEDSLIGDLLSLDLPTSSYNAPPPAAGVCVCVCVCCFICLCLSITCTVHVAASSK